MRYKVILFDNDDTLMDFQAGNRNAVNRLMDELDYHDPDRYDQYEAVNMKCWAARSCWRSVTVPWRGWRRNPAIRW